MLFRSAEFVDNKDTRLNTVGKKRKTIINVPQIGKVVSHEGKRRQITQAPQRNSIANVIIATRKGIKRKNVTRRNVKKPQKSLKMKQNST